MEFRLLGPLEVSQGGATVSLVGTKQRALLAILLLRANEFVPRDTLLEELWPGRSDAGHSLDLQVSRLRKVMGPAARLVTTPGGYVLEVESEHIDSRRFERLLDEGRRANAEHSPREARALLGEALGLWRGAALADLAHASFARAEAERLDELRLVAIEERVDADLALAGHDTLVSELEALTATHPLRERPRAQLMLALYRSGRQADALRVYAETRRLLVRDLGLEPGQSLQQLEQAVLRHDRSLDVKPVLPHVRTRRLRVVAVAVPLLAAALAGAGVLVTHGGTQSSRAQPLAQPGSVALLAATTGKLVGQLTLREPTFMRFGDGALWVASLDGELTKIDPTTGAVLASVALPVKHPGGLAVGEGSVWVTDCCSPLLVRVDPAQTIVADEFPLPTAGVVDTGWTSEVAVGAGSVWVGQGSANPSWIERLDPRGRVQKRILIPAGGTFALAFGGGALWAAGAVSGFLSKIDASTADATAVQSVQGSICCVAVGGGYTWVATRGDHTVWKLSRDGRVVTTIRLAQDVADGSLAYADGAVWGADGRAGTVVRIDPTTNDVRTYPVGHLVTGAAARGGVVAAGLQQSAEDVTAGISGRVVRVALQSDWIDSTDPVFAAGFNPQQFQFQYATCAKLFNYPDRSGAAGKELIPEVAAGWPKLTHGGRTVTIRIRRGYRFSPPSHEPVTAESFRHAIERDLSPKVAGPWRIAVLADVVGAEAYNAGATAHITGISAHGDSLVIRLLKPAPDLPERLSQPAFCAVPADLPIAAGGIDGPIPSAGPYYLAARADNVVVLRPNPNYSGPRTRRLDAIVYRWDVDPGVAAGLIAQGKIDYFSDEQVSALGPETEAAHAAGSRYRLTPNNVTEVVALNRERPLFAAAALRRAVREAVDRRELAAAVGALATSHFLSANQSGFSAEPAYSLDADLRAARRLAGTTHRRAVLAAGADAAGHVYEKTLVSTLRKQLRTIGIELRVVPLPQSGSEAGRAALLAGADIALVGSDASQTRDPVGYLRSRPYLPRSDRARLDRIATLPFARREIAAGALAVKLEREGIYIGFGAYAIPELTSKRLGCVLDQPVYPGLDLAALCLRHG